MNGFGMVFTLLVIGGLGTMLLRVADEELTGWLDERRFLRRVPSTVVLPPAVTGLRAAPVVYDQALEAELVDEPAASGWGGAA